jgi:hypothetical protein
MEVTMSDLLDKLKVLNDNKDEIIKEVRGISTEGFTKNQAQNLRENAAQTESIEEILLYIDYQCARERKLKPAGTRLSELIKRHKDKGIDVIRYMLGIFARWVMIESKRGEQP